MELITEIKQIVKEELGISEDVKRYVSEIFNQIITDARLRGKIEKPNVKTGEFQYFIQKDDSANGLVGINVIYKVIYLDSILDLDDDDFIGSSDFLGPNNFNLFTTVIYDRSKKKHIDFEGTLQHEFEHIYQQMYAGKPVLFKDSTRAIYNKANELISNSTTNAEKIVGFAVYYNTKFEKDAYANDLYKTITDNPMDNPYAILKNNVVYRNVETIRKAVLEKDNRKRFEPIVTDNFGKTYKWFLRITEHMVDAYMKKVGKVLVKAMEDIKRENNEKYSTDGGRMSIKAGPPIEE
jgi:hypothetical protein